MAFSGHIDSYDAMIQNHQVCDPFYYSWIIPKHDRGADEYLLILSSLELSILLFLWIVLCMKKYYTFIEKNSKKAKAILLPYYDRIVYWYSFITVLRMLFAIIQYLIQRVGGINHAENLWYIAFFEALSSVFIISIELFICLLIMQTSVGQNAFRRATKGTFIICLIIGILYLCRSIFGSNFTEFHIWIIFSMLIHALLLIVYIAVFCYVYIYHENLLKMRRKRNKILYIYLFVIAIIHLIFTISYILESTGIDGFCFTVIGEYIYRIIFPIIAYVTIRNDSKFWKNIIYSLQFVRVDQNEHSLSDEDHHHAPDLYENGHGHGHDHHHSYNAGSDDMLLSGGNYRKSIRSIFGEDHHHHHHKETQDAAYYDPIIGALELEINMICYDDLYDISDPFAMGTTAMVHKAKWKDEDVAVKKWIFDEIDLSLEYITEFFRETLFSNIIHPNLVQFKGACLRPPELCLVYEYVNCGDLAGLVLPNYHRGKIHPRHRDAIKIKNR